MPRCLLCITGAFHTDGGIAAVNRLVIRALAEAGYQLDIHALSESEASLDARYVRPSYARQKSYNGSKVRFTASVWLALLSKKYDFVFADHVNLASILAPAAQLGICRYMVWLHGAEVFPPRPDREGVRGLKHAWKRIASSNHTQANVAGRFPDLSVAVCDLAMDPRIDPATLLADHTESSPSIYMEAVSGAGCTLGPRTILHVGRMASRKGQDCLIRAFPAVHDQFPDAQLVLAGQGDDLPRLRALAASFPPPISDKIFIPGYVEDALLDQLYRACFLFAMPSLGEGFGLVYLEAMSRGKPCLGGKVDATPCVVRHGLTGLLVDDPRSPYQVAEALRWFLAHPEEARLMGKAGHDLVCSYYLFPHFKQRFWQALEE